MMRRLSLPLLMLFAAGGCGEAGQLGALVLPDAGAVVHGDAVTLSVKDGAADLLSPLDVVLVADLTPPTCADLLPVPQTPLQAPTAGCGFEGAGPATHVVHWSFWGHALLGVRGDGALVTLHTFATAFPERSLLYARLASRGAITAAAAIHKPPGPNPKEATLEVAILDATGALLGAATRTVPYQNWGGDVRLLASAGGLVAFGHRFGPHADTWMLLPDGQTLSQLDGYLPFTDPTDGAALSVVPIEDLYQPHWWRVCDGAVTKTAHSTIQLATTMPHALGDGFVYLRYDSPDLTYERPTALATFPSNAVVNTVGSVYDLHPSGWALLLAAGSLVSNVNVRSAVSTPFTLVLPQGQRRFHFATGASFTTAWPPEVAIDGDGRKVMGLRDDHVARVWRSRDAAQWEPIGLPLGAIHDTLVVERGGTYLIGGEGLGFVQDDYGAAPAGVSRVDGQSMHFTRPETGASVVIHDPPPGNGFLHPHHVSADGRCLACFTGDALWLFDAMTAAKRVVDLPKGAPPQDKTMTFTGADDGVIGVFP